jgi:predicted DNA-binding antitoxin AbrB/MazE fold protein
MLRGEDLATWAAVTSGTVFDYLPFRTSSPGRHRAIIKVEARAMTKNLDAIYEDGAFRPVQDGEIALSNGTRVRLTVEPVSQDPGKNVLDLAAEVYAGLSEEDVAEIENIATDRRNFFSQ